MTSIRLFVALLLLAGAAAFAATVEPATPIERAPPPYPDSAGEASGHVRIQFTIDRDGHVRDAAVQDSEPQGVFDAAALGAVAGWRYQPRRIDGQAAAAGISGFCRIAVTVAEDGTVAKADIVDMLPGTLFESACRSLTTSLRFEPPSADKTGHVTRQVDYFLRFEMPGAKNLLKHGQFAKIRYTIGTHGEIKNAEIVAASGPDVPVSQILKTFRQRRQDPAMVNGVAVEKPDQFVTITGD